MAIFIILNNKLAKQLLTKKTLRKFNIVGTILAIIGISIFSISLRYILILNSLGGDALNS